MCFGFIVYGYVVNNIIKIILWARTISDTYKHHLIIYTTYMDNLKIGKEVQYEMRDYLEHQFLEENFRNLVVEGEMKSRLPEDLRDELLGNAYLQLQNHLEYVFLRSPSIIKWLYFLQEKKFTENEVILQQGATIDQLYYLHQGEVRLTYIFGQFQHKITTISVTSDLYRIPTPFSVFMSI